MIFDLVGIAINEISLGGMRKILSLHGEDPAVAKSVMDAIHNNTQAFNITDTLRTETTIQYAYIDYARTLAPKDVMPERKTFRIFGWKFPVLSYTQDEQNAYLDATERDILHRQRLDILASEHPFPQAILIFKANDANWTKQDDTHTELARGTEDIFSGYAGTVWNDRASSLVLETSARLLVWKSQHHAFPETLSAIGDTPPDPFSGKPFGYRREGAGFVLYSVGEDGAFDGGSSPAKLYENAPVFRYSAHS